MIVKTQSYLTPPPPSLGRDIKHTRMKECSKTILCWDILLHVKEKSENKVEKDRKNLAIFHEVLANNI